MGQRSIGLTGGIATGKSTVSRYLEEAHQIPVLDADIYARQAVAVGSPVLGAIVARYGEEMLNPDGSLNRGKLGEVVFHEAQEKAWL
jgi:dephospho-CoA kinase